MSKAQDIAKIATAASMYKSYQEIMQAAEKDMQPYREILEAAALDNGGSIEVPGYKIQLSEAIREVFNLKDAKVQLGEKALRPYLRESAYCQLRVTKKKGL